jgi:mannose/cellobiose epimerase-like protein (N-acyl-D-glucosamine 2-epimerase family)
LFDEYLPFWENGGHDAQHGGFMCYLYEDGTVEDDRKDIWYQGRGIWVYSYLFNEIDPDRKWLERAQLARDFMVRHMYNGDGTWKDTVNRIGEPVEGIAIMRSNNIYGALFAAAGLIQYAKATGSEEDLELARRSIRKSMERYEQADYAGVTSPATDQRGLRAQGHAFMLVWVIPQLLELGDDPWMEDILARQLDALENRFWNPEFGISNEILFHDYSRIPGEAEQMIPGHSIEAQWMCLSAALRRGEVARAKVFRERMRRLIEMSWDYVFGGTCDTAYQVFATDTHPAGPVLDIKTMWAQSEVAIGALMAWEQSGEPWARDWFERSWTHLQRTMTTDYGVWRQAVDRRGRDKQREGISPYRRGNFHQPRCLMMLMQILARLQG